MAHQQQMYWSQFWSLGSPWSKWREVMFRWRLSAWCMVSTFLLCPNMEKGIGISTPFTKAPPTWPEHLWNIPLPNTNNFGGWDFWQGEHSEIAISYIVPPHSYSWRRISRFDEIFNLNPSLIFPLYSQMLLSWLPAAVMLLI